MASDARMSSSLTYRRVRIARRGAVIAWPGRALRAAVVAVTSFVVPDDLDVRPWLREGPLGSSWRLSWWSSRICVPVISSLLMF
jgi:hypothetical protein